MLLLLTTLLTGPSLAHGDAPDGKALYTTFCVACHGEDGTGPIGANFVTEPERLAKPDAVLLAAIKDGMTGDKGVMPPMGGVLDETQRKAVLGYLREAFGTPKPAAETGTEATDAK